MIVQADMEQRSPCSSLLSPRGRPAIPMRQVPPQAASAEQPWKPSTLGMLDRSEGAMAAPPSIMHQPLRPGRSEPARAGVQGTVKPRGQPQQCDLSNH